MKKFLSLVLALTMALSLVTVSAGATDFDDDGDITYQEAVSVIAGLGIVDGYSDGTFGPDEALTRGAAAKIICNLILGPTTADALSASSAPFVDVPTTNTFAGYITYCSQQGIISGYADGTFRPTGTLSGNAFMKMLLGALGYDSEREGYTGSNWTVNVIKQAVGIGLDDGNDNFVGSQAVTRQEACLYAFNTLQATMVEYSDNSVITVGDITINTQGEYSDVTNGTSTDGNIGGEKDGLMQFAERYFEDLEGEDDTDDFGRPATTWVYDGDELGTYANDADATYVVGDTEDDLVTLVTDDACLDYSTSDVLSSADVYYNGENLGSYSSQRSEYLAGKGDIIEAYENDDNDVDTIVIRSYTYAMIDTVDEDISSTHENNGASVALELVDIDGGSKGTWYDDYDDSDEVLTGYNSNYTEGTVLAVAFSAEDDDVILDSYIMDSVTGTPSSAREVEVFSTNSKVTDGTITIDGTRYEYAGQMTGLDDGENVDFDEEYTIYLAAEGYVLAVDGDATATLDDVYYVNQIYQENSRGREYFYAEVVSIMDGTESIVELDADATSSETDFNVSTLTGDGDAEYIKDLYVMDVDDGTGVRYRGQDRYSLSVGSLQYDVTSSSSTIRLIDSSDGNAPANSKYSLYTYNNGSAVASGDEVSRLYLEDTTFFVGIDNASQGNNSSLDVFTATGTMAAKTSSDWLKVFVIFRDGDSDAAFVVYAAQNLQGGASSEDVVYLADNTLDEVSGDNYEADLYFMEDMSLVEGLTISDENISNSSAHGFYAYEVEDDVYTLDDDEVEFISGDVNDDTDNEAAEAVVFDEVYNYLASGSNGTADFDAISFADATVIDTRSSSARSNDVYDNEINTASKLSTAIDRVMDDDIKGEVIADVFVQDGEIVFVAVREMADDTSDGDGLTVSSDSTHLLFSASRNGTYSATLDGLEEGDTVYVQAASGYAIDVDESELDLTVVSSSNGIYSFEMEDDDVDADDVIAVTKALSISGIAVEGETSGNTITVSWDFTGTADAAEDTISVTLYMRDSSGIDVNCGTETWSTGDSVTFTIASADADDNGYYKAVVTVNGTAYTSDYFPVTVYSA